jgi:DNA-binding NtrC family response regulator
MGSKGMDQAHPNRTVLIVEDDAELRDLTAALLEDEQLDTVKCESAEAALAVMLLHERDISMIFADVRLTGAMDGVDLAWEVRQRWPMLPVVLTSGQPCKRARKLPSDVTYVSKPWRPLNILLLAEQALAYARGHPR